MLVEDSMKRIILFFCILLISGILFASGRTDVTEWGTVESMYKSVEKELGHDMEKHEQTIIDTTYLYYYGKCDGKWTREKWDVALEKAVEMCRNNVAITAAKTGIFGEKLLKTLAVTTEDAVSGFNNWINSGSKKFEERHNP